MNSLNIIMYETANQINLIIDRQCWLCVMHHFGPLYKSTDISTENANNMFWRLHKQIHILAERTEDHTMRRINQMKNQKYASSRRHLE